jgi:hypothetical protein
VQRVAVHRDEWDDIPRRLTTDNGHRARVDWFTTIPHHAAAPRCPRAWGEGQNIDDPLY